MEDGICEDCHPTNCWSIIPSPISIATYTNIASKRKYGIELETSNCQNYRPLKGKTLYGVKFDCSITGMEFISPILYGDEGLQETARFLAYSRENNWQTSRDCGYHLHIDARDETTIQLRHIAYSYAKTYNAWRGLVTQHRAAHNSYCHAPSYTAEQIRNHSGSIVRFFNNSSRYNWLNLAAYDIHKTIEVRIHQGTLHAKTISYWVMAHTRFVDAVHNMTYAQIDAIFSGTPEENLTALCRIWDSAGGQRISEFYHRRFRIHN